MISTIRLDCIESSTLARPLIAGSIDALAESISNIGLIQPITVVPCAKYRDGQKVEAFRLVAGHHRVAAMRKIGWAECSARVLPDSTSALAAELMEIDENLCRAELSAAQRAKAIKRRKEIWEAMRPNSGNSVPTNAGRPKEFAGDTAAAAGMTKRAINEHLARAEALGEGRLPAPLFVLARKRHPLEKFPTNGRPKSRAYRRLDVFTLGQFWDNDGKNWP